MLDKIKQRFRSWFSTAEGDADLKQRLHELRSKVPVPVFWLLGKTQSGKTSIIKYLTGAGDAEIGHGFKPCTRTSRRYDFPTEEAALLTFIDTRGLDEPGYNAAEDIVATLDPGAFTAPWSARQIYRSRYQGNWDEDVCAENNESYFHYEMRPIPRAEKPDF